MSSVLTVSQVNMFVRSLIEGDGRLSNVLISGEISNFTHHYRSGHLYFSLKDQKGSIRAVMFADSTRSLKFMPEDGMKVIVSGRVSVYEAAGQYQIYVKSMQPDGVGALNLAFEQLKVKLKDEGLFDRKRPLPPYPEKIAVITSPTGAAVQDILNILGRRWPVAEVVLCPASVQGDLAVGQLISALKKVNQLKCADLIIIGRGGGSIEDLWAFNSEELAREVFASDIPVISAVGHETDFTICDFVADLRAPTPSAAAELAVPNVYDEMDNIMQLYYAAEGIISDKIRGYKMEVDGLSGSKFLADPGSSLKLARERLSVLTKELILREDRIIRNAKADAAVLAGKLDELSPLKVISRGYSVLHKDNGKVVTSCKDVTENDEIISVLRDGEIKMRVLSVNSGKE